MEVDTETRRRQAAETSTTEDWEHLWDLFHSLIDQPQRQWEERLAALPATIAKEVRGLLAAHRSSGDFLRSPLIKDSGSQSEAESLTTATDTATSADPLLGQQVGPYLVRQVLGEGGMGIVFLADQQQPLRRRVALKVLKIGFAARQVMARFEAERQALVMMGHPNVATAFDIGSTDDGRPYMAMEYVAGLPIDAYCDRFRLSLEQRLDLMIDVCRGVSHAHLRGVIHRDLKPSNILVTVVDGEVVPKVIDFGIAKAIGTPLTDRPAVTELGTLIGTPEYMSPEQADLAGLEVGASSDIYSLGVVLYRLLAGILPFSSEELRQKGYGNLCRLLLERPPKAPSEHFAELDDEPKHWIAACRQSTPESLQRRLAGRLDEIVLQALDKDSTQRQRSVRALAHQLAAVAPMDRPSRSSMDAEDQGSAIGRRPGIVAVAVVLMLVLAAGGYIVAHRFIDGAGEMAEDGDAVETLSTEPAEVSADPASADPASADPASADPSGATTPESVGARPPSTALSDLIVPSVAITFDDVPSMSEDLTLQEVQEVNASLLRTLDEFAVPAVAFVTGEDLMLPWQGGARRRLIEDWIEAGFELGNHTNSHGSYHRLTVEAYQQDVQRAHEALRGVLPADRPLRFFRHPFLHTGRDREHRVVLETFLHGLGYRVAPVSVEAQDWLFDDAYRKIQDDSDPSTRQRLVEAYLDLNDASFSFAEGLADDLFAAPIPLVLLVHATQLNAEALPRLLQRLDDRGYRFISLDQALSHPAYERGDEDGGIEGLTWLFRWMVAEGRAVPWKSEPQAPDWVRELANQ